MTNGSLHLGSLTIYPIKSLDGLSVAESTITPGGILEHDRAYAIFDEQGKTVMASAPRGPCAALHVRPSRERSAALGRRWRRARPVLLDAPAAIVAG